MSFLQTFSLHTCIYFKRKLKVFYRFYASNYELHKGFHNTAWTNWYKLILIINFQATFFRRFQYNFICWWIFFINAPACTQSKLSNKWYKHSLNDVKHRSPEFVFLLSGFTMNCWSLRWRCPRRLRRRPSTPRDRPRPASWGSISTRTTLLTESRQT